MSSYETNTQMPPLDVLKSIASVLNVSLDYLSGAERKEIIVLDGLSKPQKELIHRLMAEFTSPTGKNDHLSQEHKDILDKVLRIFYGVDK